MFARRGDSGSILPWPAPEIRASARRSVGKHAMRRRNGDRQPLAAALITTKLPVQLRDGKAPPQLRGERIQIDPSGSAAGIAIAEHPVTARDEFAEGFVRHRDLP